MGCELNCCQSEELPLPETTPGTVPPEPLLTEGPVVQGLCGLLPSLLLLPYFLPFPILEGRRGQVVLLSVIWPHLWAPLCSLPSVSLFPPLWLVVAIDLWLAPLWLSVPQRSPRDFYLSSAANGRLLRCTSKERIYLPCPLSYQPSHLWCAHRDIALGSVPPLDQSALVQSHPIQNTARVPQWGCGCGASWGRRGQDGQMTSQLLTVCVHFCVQQR